MPISEAKKRANKKWNDNNLKDRYDRVQLVVPKGVKAAIEEYAKRHGDSVNGLMNRLLMAEMGATPESWKRGDVSSFQGYEQNKPETALEVMKRLAAKELKEREQMLKEHVERREEMKAFFDNMSSKDK